jgi:hypothetical protein
VAALSSITVLRRAELIELIGPREIEQPTALH